MTQSVKTQNLTIGAALLSLIITTPLYAQEAPPPRKSPRTPVNRQTLETRQETIPVARVMQGIATILDAEKLRLGETEIRLFGIVPPQLSASFGPQARAALDTLTAGKNVTCTMRDRARDGRLLAVCKSGDTDLAQELLQRGLAVTARGSLSNTEYATSYINAEQAAQGQKIGLWSMIVPAPATPPIATTKIEPIKSEPAKPEAPKPEPEAKTETPPISALPAPAIAVHSQHINTAPQPASILTATPPSDGAVRLHEQNFIQRYQMIIAGVLILLTALGTILTVIGFRLREKREEVRTIAAALRGELMAARAVCHTRLRTITNDDDDKTATWPRIRSTLYQAYVGRLGWLGAELSRKIASIYGQTGDYANYYNNLDDHSAKMPKRQALETLIRYIDAVLPKLVTIEQTGRAPKTNENALKLMPASAAFVPEAMDIDAPVQDAIPHSTTGSLLDKLENMPLWNAVRSFTQEKITLRYQDTRTGSVPDYAVMIEEEMESMGFTDDEHGTDGSNVTKIRKIER